MTGAGRHQERADLPGGRPLGVVEEKPLTPQSINLIVKRRCAMGGLGPGGVLGARTPRRISDRGGAARDCAAGGDAAVPAPGGPAGRELLQGRARGAGRQGWGFSDGLRHSLRCGTHCASLTAVQNRRNPGRLKEITQNMHRKVTPKHPPHFTRKLSPHRCDRLSRFLFVRDAIRFRSGDGLVQAATATKKEGGAWELHRKTPESTPITTLTSR